MRPLLLASFLLLATFAPTATADPVSDAIASHQAYDPGTREFCSSADPELAFVSTDLTSSMSAAPAESGGTTFTIHLDATLPDPAFDQVACGAIDLVLTSGLAWPPTDGFEAAPFTSTCGVTGYFFVYHSSGGTSVQLYLSDGVPPACGLPFPRGMLGWNMQAVHPQTAYVCSPLVAPACVGAESQTFRYAGCDGSDVSRFDVAIGVTLVYIDHGCQWQDHREHASVNDGIGIVQIDTTSDSCQVNVFDFVGLVGTTSMPCPEQARSVVYDTDWAHLIP